MKNVLARIKDYSLTFSLQAVNTRACLRDISSSVFSSIGKKSPTRFRSFCCPAVSIDPIGERLIFYGPGFISRLAVSLDLAYEDSFSDGNTLFVLDSSSPLVDAIESELREREIPFKRK